MVNKTSTIAMLYILIECGHSPTFPNIFRYLHNIIKYQNIINSKITKGK
jgi:hypothetical protein